MLEQACAQLREYFAGTRREFEFRSSRTARRPARCWAALAAIPYGNTWSYRDLAARVGPPGGDARGRRRQRPQPLPIVLPCHRSSAPTAASPLRGGLPTKAFLLRLEVRRACTDLFA